MILEHLIIITFLYYFSRALHTLILISCEWGDDDIHKYNNFFKVFFDPMFVATHRWFMRKEIKLKLIYDRNGDDVTYHIYAKPFLQLCWLKIDEIRIRNASKREFFVDGNYGRNRLMDGNETPEEFMQKVNEFFYKNINDKLDEIRQYHAKRKAKPVKPPAPIKVKCDVTEQVEYLRKSETL